MNSTQNSDSLDSFLSDHNGLLSFIITLKTQITEKNLTKFQEVLVTLN